MRTSRILAPVLALAPLALAAELPGQTHELASPDGAVRVTIDTPEGEGLRWAVAVHGASVLAPSPLGLTVDGEALGPGLRIEGVERQRVDTTWERYWGKRSVVESRYDELTVRLRDPTSGRTLGLVVRAYDDGAAFRWAIPASWGRFEIRDETTELVFPGDVTVWATTFGGFHASQEGIYHRRPVSSLAADSVYGLPLLVRAAPGAWAAITEADLTDWAGLWLSRGSRPTAVRARLAPHPGEGVAVRSEGPRLSPWRVLLLGETAASLLESDVIQDLNDPPADDFSWVEPGIASWNWWNGPWLPDADFEVGMNTATMKAFVDLSAEMGWRYVLVDEGWYGPAFADGAVNTTWNQHPESRITTWIPELDLPALIRYAGERGVKVILWLHWGHVQDQMVEAFLLYREWGVAGVKIDFMDRDDQWMVDFYHRVAERAADNRLLVDFHGAYKPTGVSRTWPNLVTREGVLGSEYNKWTDSITPEHNVTIPFTRGLLGEMDYTPGGFRQKTVETFHAQSTAPLVMGTRAHQLAMFVVYESALQVASESPYAYRVSPRGTDFLAMVPTTWDDTRALAGEPGDYVAVARRSGPAWYIGAMSDEEPRTLRLPLEFLPPGEYRAEIWADAYEADEFPDRLLKSERVVAPGDTLNAVMAPGGGYVARLVPVP